MHCRKIGRFAFLLGASVLCFGPAPTFANGIDTAESVNNLPINVEGVMGMTLVNKSGTVYVGIGTSAPYMPLTIHTGPDQNLGVVSAAGWGVSGIALQSYKDDLSNSEPLLLQSSTLYLQPTGGDVGIGTTAPQGLLHVYRSAGAVDTVGGEIILNRYLSGGSWRGGAIFNYYPSGFSHDVLAFGVSEGATAPDTLGAVKMVIGANGNVGIGTTNPYGRLQLQGQFDPNDGMVLYQQANNTHSIQTYIDGHWTDRTTYAGGCCNALLLEPDVGVVGVGSASPIGNLDIESTTSPGNAKLCLNGSCTTSLTSSAPAVYGGAWTNHCSGAENQNVVNPETGGYGCPSWAPNAHAGPYAVYFDGSKWSGCSTYQCWSN